MKICYQRTTLFPYFKIQNDHLLKPVLLHPVGQLSILFIFMNEPLCSIFHISKVWQDFQDLKFFVKILPMVHSFFCLFTIISPYTGPNSSMKTCNWIGPHYRGERLNYKKTCQNRLIVSLLNILYSFWIFCIHCEYFAGVSKFQQESYLWKHLNAESWPTAVS